ncbi:MAG: hypothetical protein ABSG76_17755, partial [Xanthobacteraceae bacterium]
FAHAAGLLLLAHTGRIRMFGASAPRLMETYVQGRIAALDGGASARPTLKQLLLADEPRAEIPMPRRSHRRRPPKAFGLGD